MDTKSPFAVPKYGYAKVERRPTELKLRSIIKNPYS